MENPQSKKKRKQFTLKEKMDILKEVDKGRKNADVARSFGLVPTTLSTIIKDREKIIKLYEQSSLSAGRKRLRLGDNQDLEVALNNWLKDMRAQNVPKLEKKIWFAAIERYACIYTSILIPYCLVIH